MIEWLDGDGTVEQDRINLIEQKLGHKLPNSFVECVKFNDGGTPIKSIFEYFKINDKKLDQDCIGSFLCLNENQIMGLLETFLNPPEFFPQGLLAFASTGGGDFICFDYRTDTNNIDPSVLFWNHEADIGVDVSYVAHNFKQFLSLLEKSPYND